MRARRRPRRPARWAPTTTVPYHQDAPNRSGPGGLYGGHDDWTPQDNSPPLQGGVLAVPLGITRGESVGAEFADLVTLRDESGLTAVEMDIARFREYLDLVAREEHSEILRVQAPAPVAGFGSEGTAVWDQPTETASVLLATVAVHGNSDITSFQAPAGWTLVRSRQSGDRWLRVYRISGGAVRSGGETFRWGHIEEGPPPERLPTFVADNAYFSVAISEQSGAELNQVVDQQIDNAGTSTSPSTGTTGETEQDVELGHAVIMNVSDDAQSSPTNGYSQVQTAGHGGASGIRLGVYEKDLSAKATTSMGVTLPNSRAWIGMLVTFRAKSGSPPAPELGRVRLHAHKMNDLTRLFTISEDAVHHPVHTGEAAEALVATSETTTSTSFTDLATTGPAVTVDVGPSGKVLVIVSCDQIATSAEAIMGYEISGANSQAATLDRCLRTSTGRQMASFTDLLTGLTPGLTTFTAKYRSGTAATSTYERRRIAVVPL
jgi:hypothetical protein